MIPLKQVPFSVGGLGDAFEVFPRIQQRDRFLSHPRHRVLQRPRGALPLSNPHLQEVQGFKRIHYQLILQTLPISSLIETSLCGLILRLMTCQKYIPKCVLIQTVTAVSSAKSQVRRLRHCLLGETQCFKCHCLFTLVKGQSILKQQKFDAQSKFDAHLEVYLWNN